MVCNQCNYKFHNCSSCCSNDPFLDNGFCSQKCFEASNATLTIKHNLLELASCLTKEQNEMIKNILGNDELMIGYCEKWIIEYLEGKSQ